MTARPHIPIPDGLYALGKSDVLKAARTLADAFYAYPLFSFLTEGQRRRKALELMFEVEMRFALRNGAAYSLDQNTGEVMTWYFDKGRMRGALGFLRCIRPRTLRLFCLAGLRGIQRIDRIARVIEARKKKLHLPPNTVFLSALGVKTPLQGQKRASRLLWPMLRALSAHGLHAFLYTNAQKNVAVYERFGFELLDEIEHPHGLFKSYILYRE